MSTPDMGRDLMVATGIMMKAAFPVEEASKRALSELYEQFRDL